MENTNSKLFPLKFIVASIVILAAIGWAASILSTQTTAIIGLLSFIVSLIATVIAPNSQSDFMRVLRFLGDIGSTVLVYATVNSTFDLSKWVVMGIALIFYVLLAIRFNRDL